MILGGFAFAIEFKAAHHECVFYTTHVEKHQLAALKGVRDAGGYAYVVVGNWHCRMFVLPIHMIEENEAIELVDVLSLESAIPYWKDLLL